MKRGQTSRSNIGDKAPHDSPSPDSKLPKNSLKLLDHITEICHKSPDRSCFKSIKNIAADCGMALQTAHNHKHLLRELGIIRIDERPNGKRANPRHRITLVEEKVGGKLEPRQSTSTVLCRGGCEAREPAAREVVSVDAVERSPSTRSRQPILQVRVESWSRSPPAISGRQSLLLVPWWSTMWRHW